MSTDAEEFAQYTMEARNSFVASIEEQEWNTKLRTAAEDLLICFDQMRERLKPPRYTKDFLDTMEKIDEALNNTRKYLNPKEIDPKQIIRDE